MTCSTTVTSSTHPLQNVIATNVENAKCSSVGKIKVCKWVVSCIELFEGCELLYTSRIGDFSSHSFTGIVVYVKNSHIVCDKSLAFLHAKACWNGFAKILIGKVWTIEGCTCNSHLVVKSIIWPYSSVFPCQVSTLFIFVISIDEYDICGIGWSCPCPFVNLVSITIGANKGHKFAWKISIIAICSPNVSFNWIPILGVN